MIGLNDTDPIFSPLFLPQQEGGARSRGRNKSHFLNVINNKLVFYIKTLS